MDTTTQQAGSPTVEPTGQEPSVQPQDNTAEPNNSPNPQTDVRALSPEGGNGDPQSHANESDTGILSDPNLADSSETQDQQGAGVLGAPEAGYSFEPTDSTVHLDEESLKGFAEVAQELNLSQEAAQKIVSKMEPMLAATIKRNRAEWAKASRADKEFGGANFENNMKAAHRAYLATTSEGLRNVLVASGLDSHPEVLRHFYGLSKTLGEGRYVTSSGNRESAVGRGLQGFYKGMNP